MNLALFDFDGTITSEDTYSKFIFYSTSKWRLGFGYLFAWPIVTSYWLGWVKPSVTRPIVSRIAFAGRRVKVIEDIAHKYVAEYLPSVIRPEMHAKIAWHQEQGDDIFVVSASVDIYLRLWCEQQGIGLVCSELKTCGAYFTGGYVQGDCSLERKVTFLQPHINLSNYQTIYAYGDSDEDKPLLGIADVKYYQGKPI
ncbi:HAD-IB family phosphatase [Vibrio sp.]|nr:HAD-IB family phosphatase [Vibrio sp.]